MQTRTNRPWGGRNGAFTLVELLVATAVVGILLSLVYQIFISQQRGYVLQEDLADAQQNARVAVETLTRDLGALGTGAVLDRGRCAS